VGAVSNYTFNNIGANQTISALFKADTHTVIASSGSGGTISPSGKVVVTAGLSPMFTISPGAGYRIADVLVDGNTVGKVSDYTFDNIGSNHTISAIFDSENQPPIADAGPDQTVDEGQEVVLSGRNSRDPDDGIASMQWRQLQGPSVVLNGADTAEAKLTAPDVNVHGASLVFELTVIDFSGAQSSDTCIVNVIWVNMPPSADAGQDQIVFEGQTVALDAHGSSDPDDGIAAYLWKQIEGPAVLLANPASVEAYFTAPLTRNGVSLVFELTVMDHGGLQATDTTVVNVVAENLPPVANAGHDQIVYPGDDVLLDGGDSFDPEGVIASYKWKQTSGPPVELSHPGSVRSIFKAPPVQDQDLQLAFELTVTDAVGLKGVDDCQITVKLIDTSESSSISPSAIIHKGNQKSKVFHQPVCKDYNCKHCVVQFSSRQEAIDAGYRPCGTCRP
jgi:hypothetical protein